MIDLDDLRRAVSVADILENVGIEPPGGKRRIECPIHNGDDRNFSVNTDGTRWACWSRCGFGDVIDLAAQLRACSTGEAIRWLASLAGLRREEAPSRPGFSIERPPLRLPTARPDAGKTATALRLWGAARSAVGTAVESYLRRRGIDASPPSSLRFHPGARHPNGGTYPCMIALVTLGLTDKPVAVHRTYLASVTPRKAVLGPVRGGAVRLGGSGDPLLIGEGIETCLSGRAATGHAAWAALSTSGLQTLELPDSVSEVVILADGDNPGRIAAEQAAGRWIRSGRHVRIAWPPAGLDANDLLLRAST